MHGTVYAIAFEGDRFIMVRHPRRGGWEMPGGSIEPGETPEDAAVREFREEAGYAIRVLSTRDIGNCYVCAAVTEGRLDVEHEMPVEFFTEIPEELSFDRAEYEDTVPWAASVVGNDANGGRPHQ